MNKTIYVGYSFDYIDEDEKIISVSFNSKDVSSSVLADRDCFSQFDRERFSHYFIEYSFNFPNICLSQLDDPVISRMKYIDDLSAYQLWFLVNSDELCHLFDLHSSIVSFTEVFTESELKEKNAFRRF